MKYLRKIPLLLAALLMGIVPLVSSVDVGADPLGSFTSYPVPNIGAASVITEATDGSLWTVNNPGQNPDQRGVVKISKSGSVSVYNDPPLYDSYHDITSARDGSVWFSNGSRIGTVTAQGQAISYEKPQSLWSATHGTVEGPDGNIWFAIGDGYPGDAKIGRMTKSGTFLPTYSIDGYHLTGLVSDFENNVVWYSVRPVDSNDPHKIGKFNMDGTQTEFVLPPALGLGSMILGPDGNLWFINGPGKIGKMTPSGDFTIHDLGYSLTTRLRRLTVGLDGYIWATRQGKTVARISTSGSATIYTIYPTGGMSWQNNNAYGLVGGRDGNIWVLGEGPKQITKVGTGYTDNDEDGLQYSQEVLQGTVDNNPDTDGDGLSDYIESVQYPVRDQVFCNDSMSTCDYPDPLAKDIYIENDWMAKPGVDGYSMQLNSSQVSDLVTAFADKSTTLHVDTGQLGGGTQVPYTSEINFIPQAGITDFYDYKLGGDGLTASMSPLRKDIFHYLITGQAFSEAPGSSGVSYAGDDDFFVAYGNLKESLSPSMLDTAVSSTVIHELGHNLCLTDENNGNPAYSGQPASCRFAGIDAYFSPSYFSAMNYNYQLHYVDYSDGQGGVDDHDDWGAIRLGDFTKSTAGDIAHGVTVKNPTFKHRDYKKRNSKHERPIIGPAVSKLKISRP